MSKKSKTDWGFEVDELMPEGWTKAASREAVIKVAEEMERFGIRKRTIEEMLAEVVDAVRAEYGE